MPQDNDENKMNAYSRFALAQVVGEPSRHGLPRTIVLGEPAGHGASPGHGGSQRLSGNLCSNSSRLVISLQAHAVYFCTCYQFWALIPQAHAIYSVRSYHRCMLSILGAHATGTCYLFQGAHTTGTCYLFMGQHESGTCHRHMLSILGAWGTCAPSKDQHEYVWPPRVWPLHFL